MKKKQLTEIVSILFIEKHRYKEISKEDKKANFFIINRFLSLTKPNVSIFLNKFKNIETHVLFDMLFLYTKNDRIDIRAFWKANNIKPEKTKELEIDPYFLMEEEIMLTEIKKYDKYLYEKMV